MQNYLNEDKLKRLVPSAFALNSASHTSSKYEFIATISCVNALISSGFYPTYATQTNCRKQEKMGFTKHMIRFRHVDFSNTEVGGYLPEIVLVNSHDGTSSYQLTGGIYRLVCGNGLIVGNPLFSRSVIHKGNAIEKVLEAATDLIEISPISVKTIKEWEKIELSDKQKEIYSESAKMLKWDKDEEINILPSQLLRSRRYEDKKNDLWTTFNVIQENIIKGGLRYRKSNDKRLNSTRGTSSITENVRLNTALWNLTEKMAELAA